MNTDDLRWFQLVADGVTVTEVSEIFGVSQPSVSRALARLESEVGAPLLERQGSSADEVRAPIRSRRSDSSTRSAAS